MMKFMGSLFLSACLFLLSGTAIAQGVCETDYNGDGVSDAADVEIFRSALGSAVGDDEYFSAADLDGDGAVTSADYAILLACS